MPDDVDELDGLRMPRFSWDYEDLSEADHWFLMARAYLDSGKHLFAQMISKTVESSFHHAKVAAFLFEHAVELFLKAAIVQAGRRAPATHRLGQLYKEFKNLYQGQAYSFEGNIDDFAAPDPSTPHGQFSRYPTDPSGKPWPGHRHIDLVIWYKQICAFSEDFQRLEPLIKSGPSSAGPSSAAFSP